MTDTAAEVARELVRQMDEELQREHLSVPLGRWLESHWHTVRAALVAAAAPPPPAVQGDGVDDAKEQIAHWMMSFGYATGHGDTTLDLLAELEAQIFKRAAAPPAVMPGSVQTAKLLERLTAAIRDPACPIELSPLLMECAGVLRKTSPQGDGWRPPEGEFFSEPDHYRVVFRPKGAGNFCGADVVVAVTSTGSGEEKRWCTRIAEALNTAEGDGWREIASAPKDNSAAGKRFLFGRVEDGRFAWIVSGFFQADGTPWHDGEHMNAFSRMPTHFRAWDLPSPHAAEKA